MATFSSPPASSQSTSCMQKQTAILLIGVLFLLGAGGLVVQQTLVESETPVGRWTTADEVEVPAAPEAAGAPLPEGSELERTAVDPEVRDGGEQRVAVILRGRVVDKFTQPVAEARVWLDFGRGGQRGGQQNRQRRVPEPVMTDREGRFAFQGQTFRNLQVTLQILHRTHALGHFEKDIGDVGSEVDLGELVLNQGGELRGRVTDLDGNGVAAAELQLNPENGNQLRFARDRERLLAGATTDANGYFRCVNVPNGGWSVSAVAKRHTEGRSPTFVVEEELLVEIDDIRLGPGYEITGYVKSVPGQPIAKATVVMRSENRNRNPGGGGRGPEGGGGRGGGGGAGGGPGAGEGGREHRATTDEQGRFFLEHLPGASMRLETSADGYLDNTLTGIDPTSSPPVLVTLQDGLRIAGAVRDADATPVTMFAVRAIRIRGLPQPARSASNFDDIAPRDGNVDVARRAQQRARAEDLRESMVAEGRRGVRGIGPPDGGGGGGPGVRDLGRPERHAGGTFVLTGLQEGIYEVHVQSPNHARYRSAEVELRLGIAPPDLSIVLDDGVSVAGVVRSEAGDPVAGARVELRSVTADEGTPRRAERGNNNGPDLQAFGRELRQALAATRFTQEATTGADGLFVIKHAQRGSYRLHAEARNYSPADSETFELQADRSGFELRLGALGSIAGKVRGLAEREFVEARVAAVPIGAAPGGGYGALFGRGRGGGPGGNPFQGVTCGPDGTYRIDGLVPGTYAVRAWIGSPQELMRELAPQFLDGSMLADVTVRAAEVATLDVTVTRPQVGTVSGNVMHNGSPASGFQVELTRQDESGAPQNGFGGRRPGAGGRAEFFGGRSFQTAVATSGNFSIANVPAGSYRLRVTATRRGGLLHEEAVLVSVNRTTQCLVALQTTNLAGSITRDDGGNAAELIGRVLLLPGLTAVPENLNVWQRENTSFDARIQNGTFKFTALKPGGYLLVLTVRGRERTELPIVVGSTDQTVVVPAGKATAATQNEAASSPRPSNRPPR